MKPPRIYPVRRPGEDTPPTDFNARNPLRNPRREGHVVARDVVDAKTYPDIETEGGYPEETGRYHDTGLFGGKAYGRILSHQIRLGTVSGAGTRFNLANDTGWMMYLSVSDGILDLFFGDRVPAVGDQFDMRFGADPRPYEVYLPEGQQTLTFRSGTDTVAATGTAVFSEYDPAHVAQDWKQPLG